MMLHVKQKFCPHQLSLVKKKKTTTVPDMKIRSINDRICHF